jgi:hypothetical protein
MAWVIVNKEEDFLGKKVDNVFSSPEASLRSVKKQVEDKSLYHVTLSRGGIPPRR